MSSKIRLFEKIRTDHRRNGMSVRALAARYDVHRRTVREAIASAVPKAREPRTVPAPKLDQVKALIDEMLVVDLTAPVKQRHTARRIFERLVDEHAVVDLSYSTVRDYVKVRRPEIRIEAGRAILHGFVPQDHLPGEEAECDFGEVYVDLAGVRTKCFMFALRMSFSGKAAHKIFLSQGLEAFVEGHEYALAMLGGVPTKHIRYDNLKPAVAKVIGGVGRRRVETERWVQYRSHVGIDPMYCMPGVEGAHEKGGVEGEVGRFRRAYLTPVPVVDSLEQLNDLIESIDMAEDARHVDGRVTTIGQDFAVELPLLRPLPREPYVSGTWLHPKVDRYAQIAVRSHQYSVPVRLIAREVRVLLCGSELVVYEGRKEVARHRRCIDRGGKTLVLDHYLEILVRRPAALTGATALNQARRAGVFTAAHDAFWDSVRRVHGEAAALKVIIEVLLLHRHLAHADVVAGLRAATASGACNADVVAIEARKANQARPQTAGASPARPPLLPVEADDHDVPECEELAQVISLTERRLLSNPDVILSALPPDRRPLPSVAHYDQLLRLRKQPTAPTQRTERVS